jgi:hypothetical protein
VSLDRWPRHVPPALPPRRHPRGQAALSPIARVALQRLTSRCPAPSAARAPPAATSLARSVRFSLGLQLLQSVMAGVRNDAYPIWDGRKMSLYDLGFRDVGLGAWGCEGCGVGGLAALCRSDASLTRPTLPRPSCSSQKRCRRQLAGAFIVACCVGLAFLAGRLRAARAHPPAPGCATAPLRLLRLQDYQDGPYGPNKVSLPPLRCDGQSLRRRGGGSAPRGAGCTG